MPIESETGEREERYGRGEDRKKMLLSRHIMSAEHEPTHAKVEEIPSDDEAPGLEPVETPELAGEAGEGKTQNRNEKKVRKHLSKAGLVPVKDVTKLSVKKGGQVRVCRVSNRIVDRIVCWL